MPPIALNPSPRAAASTPVRPTTIKPLLPSRQSQVLKSGREPAQLSLFPRPSGAR